MELFQTQIYKFFYCELIKMKNAFLVADRIYLSELALEDITEEMMFWYNNPEVCTGNGQHIFPKPKQDPNIKQGLVDYINAVTINSLSKSKTDYC